MANRTGTYVAFDGLGESDPSKSDYCYYSTLQMWSENKKIDFKLVNSHEKTAAVRDSSQKETLRSRIRERLSASKQMLVIISSDTRKSGSELSYEIEKAIDLYKIPLIIAYPEYKVIATPQRLSAYWPTTLKTRIDNGTARAIHIPFTQQVILDALSQFSVNGAPLQSPNHIYNHAAHCNWGLCNSNEQFMNKLK